MASAVSVSLASVDVRYGRVQALRGVDLSLSSGVVALLGPNGAGKTTLIKTVIGMIAPKQGRVSTLGADPVRHPQRVAAQVGWLPQDAALPDRLRCLEVVAYAAWLKGHEWSAATRMAGRTLASVGLDDRLETRVRALSGGMQRRVALATAMVHTPSVLMLDEPLNGLDPEQRATIRELIRDYADTHDACVILSTPILADLPRLADRVLVLAHGKITMDQDLSELTATAHGADLAELESRYRRATSGQES